MACVIMAPMGRRPRIQQRQSHVRSRRHGRYDLEETAQLLRTSKEVVREVTCPRAKGTPVSLVQSEITARGCRHTNALSITTPQHRVCGVLGPYGEMDLPIATCSLHT